MWYNASAKQKNNDMMGALYFYRGFFAYPYFTMDVEFGKNANSATIVESYTHIVVFVWRQLGFAFFGALTSVGALFILSSFQSENQNADGLNVDKERL